MNRWLAVLAVVAACKSAPKHSAPAHERVQVHAVVHQTTPDDAAFVIANPAVTQARVPARFDAALPA